MAKCSNKCTCNKPTTHYCLVLDKSGSMASISKAVIEAVNDRIQHIREVAKDQNVTVTLVTFANQAKVEFFNADVSTMKPLTSFSPSGMTALWDGVGLGMDQLMGLSQHSDNTAFLVEVITDGEENVSRNYTAARLVEKIKKSAQDGNWTLAFQVPNGCKKALVNNFGIPSDCVFEWSNTVQGTQEATRATCMGFNSYFDSRSQGKLKVKSFYAPVDLAKVEPKQLKKLDDLSGQFKVIEATKEWEIKPLVESITKREYVTGQCKYEVVKKETIQANKEVFVMERGTNKVYGGDQARNLIGLPVGIEAKMDPVNLSNYRVFVESRSVNRKIPRGSKVLIDMHPVSGKQPTWTA